MFDIHPLRGPAGQPSATGSFVGSPVAASASPSGRTDEEPTIPLNKDGWAQFSELVTCVGEDELAAFIREHAALLRPVTLGEEEFAVILHGYADFLRNSRPKEPAIPLKATDRAPLRGTLAMSEDELTAFICDNKIEFPAPTPESEAQAEWEARLFEAIETGEIGRKKPGRKLGKSKERDAARAIAQTCLAAAGGHSGNAKRAFIKQIGALNHIERDRAKNLWYEVTEAAERTRRVR
jgi:hypothetical protein